jgi:hypothetical protein
MLGRRHEIAWLQSDFYRNKFRKTLNWLIVSLIIIFIMIALIVYYVLFAAPERYYGNTIDGQILVMPPAQGG